MNARKIGLGVLVGVCLLVSATASAGSVNTVADVEYWVGSGANQAVIAIDWNNGQSNASMAWGVKFDGSLTVADAYTAIAKGDAGVYSVFNVASTFFLAFAYDNDHAGTQGVNIPGSGDLYPDSDGIIDYAAWNVFGSTPVDSNDFYGGESGISNGVGWNFYVPDTTTYDPEGAEYPSTGTVGTATSYGDITFTAGSVGTGALSLQNDSWVVASFGDLVSWVHQAPPDVLAPQAAVPEPATMSLLAVGGIALLRRRKK